MRKMKKLLVSLLALLLVVTMLPISATATTPDDTAQEPVPTTTAVPDSGWIAIDDAAEFLKIGTEGYPTTGNYYLTADIDFADRTDPENPVMREFTNYVLAAFDGTLDGRNFAIKGFTINGNNANTALIGNLGKNAKTSSIINLKIGTATEDVTVNATLASAKNVAVLAAEVSNTNNVVLIDNVHIYADVSATNSSTGLIRVAGIGGYVCGATIMNSSFTGNLTGEGTGTTARCGMGGLFGETEGSNKNKQNVIKNCQVNATMTSEFGGSCTCQHANQCTVGGLIGRMLTPSVFVEDCTVAGNLKSEQKTEETSAPYGYVGGLVGYMNGTNILLVAADCDVSGVEAMSGTETGAMYGGKSAATTRCYVKGCTPDTANTPAREIGDVDGVTSANAYDYVWLIDEAADFAKIGKADSGYTYPLDGFYRLDADTISLGAKSGNVVGAFCGVLDGNGKAVTATSMNNSFFSTLSATNSAAIFDFTLGAPDAYVSVSFDALNVGALAQYTGENAGTVLSNVDIYADVTSTGGMGTWTGGFIATPRYTNFFDCNMYGSVTSLGALTNTDRVTNDTRKQMYTGGFVAQQDKSAAFNIFVDCNNLASVKTAGVGFAGGTVSNAYTGGLMGSITGGVVLYGCNNLGDVAMKSTTNFVTRNAGGMVGDVSSSGTVLMMDCANLGNVSSTMNASGLVSASNAVLNCYDVLQAGTVTADTKAESFKNAAGTATLNTRSVKTVTNPVAMDHGAAVRLAADTGLRFTATVSADVMARLTEIAGTEMTVSYGMMIAPTVIVNATASKELTHANLDAYAAAQEWDAAKGEVAYIDVPSVDEDGNNVWFKGTAGKLAGSIVGVSESMYQVKFSGAAYVTVKVGDSAVWTVYAANAQSRSLYEVAKAALDDTKTEIDADGGYTADKAIAVGEIYYENGEAKTFAEGDAPVYSYYAKAQRDIVNGIIAAADQAAAQ